MTGRSPSIFALLTAALITSACATTADNHQPGPLLIQEQGSFATGGTVITAPGTFDPIKEHRMNGPLTDVHDDARAIQHLRGIEQRAIKADKRRPWRALVYPLACAGTALPSVAI